MKKPSLEGKDFYVIHQNQDPDVNETGEMTVSISVFLSSDRQPGIDNRQLTEDKQIVKKNLLIVVCKAEFHFILLEYNFIFISIIVFC
jgi:hypothetical protein